MSKGTLEAKQRRSSGSALTLIVGFGTAVLVAATAAGAPVYGGDATGEWAASGERPAGLEGAWTADLDATVSGLSRFERALGSMETGLGDDIVLDRSKGCDDASCVGESASLIHSTSVAEDADFADPASPEPESAVDPDRYALD